MDWMSSEDKSGVEQNVQGPMPSFMQIIFPQLRQFGAAASRGWRVAWQSQRRLAVSAAVVDESERFVCISRARMAESRSLRVVEAPCIGVPPERAILVLGAGEEVREFVVRTFGRSERRVPAADGGGLGDAVREVGLDPELTLGN